MLAYGCTRIEIGVQSIFEDVARDTNRGHTVAAVAHSFQLAKDTGYKVRLMGHVHPHCPIRFPLVCPRSPSFPLFFWSTGGHAHDA